MGLQRTVIAGVVAALIGVGCGGGHDDDRHSAAPVPSEQAEGARTIDVTMRDIHFDPAAVTVKAGETVTFVFHNEGDIIHDAFIGNEEAQEEHEEEMREGGGHHGQDHQGGIRVEPGKTASITHTFGKAGTTFIGCHEPGHYAGGMKVTVTVT